MEVCRIVMLSSIQRRQTLAHGVHEIVGPPRYEKKGKIRIAPEFPKINLTHSIQLLYHHGVRQFQFGRRGWIGWLDPNIEFVERMSVWILLDALKWNARTAARNFHEFLGGRHFCHVQRDRVRRHFHMGSMTGTICPIQLKTHRLGKAEKEFSLVYQVGTGGSINNFVGVLSPRYF